MTDFTTSDLDAILYCIKYTAEHKFKKDPIRQCMLAEIADKLETAFSCFGYDYTDENFLTEEETNELFESVDLLNEMLKKHEGGNNG